MNEHRLVLSSQGLREKYFINLYGVGLYFPDPPARVGEIRSPEMPKAFRVDVTYDTDRVVTILDEWRTELMPQIGGASEQVLRKELQDIAEGDLILIAYTPGDGTAVTLNGRIIARDIGHEMIGAFIDIWLGEHPVSEELRESLLRGTAASRARND